MLGLGFRVARVGRDVFRVIRVGWNFLTRKVVSVILDVSDDVTNQEQMEARRILLEIYPSGRFMCMRWTTDLTR